MTMHSDSTKKPDDEEDVDTTTYPTPWVVQALCNPKPGGCRSLRRKLSRYVYQDRVVWPGEALYPVGEADKPGAIVVPDPNLPDLRPLARKHGDEEDDDSPSNPFEGYAAISRYAYIYPSRSR